jgi:hypothetical protein
MASCRPRRSCSWASSVGCSSRLVRPLFALSVPSNPRYVHTGLFWLAFTTYKSVHWLVPIAASVPFGAGVYFVFTSSFTYLVVAYRPVAASAMAGNSALRSSFAAGFPLFAGAMYARLGTVGATALLAGLTAVMAPFPCVAFLCQVRWSD